MSVLTAKSKISKLKKSNPTPLEMEVATALFEIEISPSADLRVEMRDISLLKAAELETKAGKKVLVVTFPKKSWSVVKGVHSKLLGEMEKKFPTKHVVFTTDREIVSLAMVKYSENKVICLINNY